MSPFEGPRENRLQPRLLEILEVAPLGWFTSHISSQLQGCHGALEVSVCQRHGYAHTPQQEMPSLPRRPKLPANLDLDKIRSPVAHYIKNSPAPPLLPVRFCVQGVKKEELVMMVWRSRTARNMR